MNGKNGEPLLNTSIKMLVGTQSSPLTLSSVSGKMDSFIYWFSSCLVDNATKIEDNIVPFRIMPGLCTNNHDCCIN